MFGGDRSTRLFFDGAIITAATREGGAKFDILYCLSQDVFLFADTVHALSTSFVYSAVTAALEVLVAGRQSLRRLANVVPDSIFVAFLCENEREGMVVTVHAVSWTLFLFGGDRSTRRDPHRVIIPVATREGGAIFDVLGIFVRTNFFFLADIDDALTLRFVWFGGDRSTRSFACRAIIAAATREVGARFDIWVDFR